jgi:hypothetical protein
MAFAWLMSLALALAIFLMGEEPLPAWFPALFVGVLLLDVLGGVRATEDAVRFRRWIRAVEVPRSSIARVTAYPGWGNVFVVTLRLHDGGKVRLTPMSTLSEAQARQAARALAALIEVDPPPRNWDGT